MDNSSTKTPSLQVEADKLRKRAEEARALATLCMEDSCLKQLLTDIAEDYERYAKWRDKCEGK